ncbi:MAG: GTPase [Candidatus Schekmanbacteria bacterium]|nr:GTPase [Candidatus Schekmanbacteria bacterium]
MTSTRTVIMGAAGKDFHVFNTLFRGRDEVHVVAFTATQIPGIAGRKYPAALAGPGYPHGIPIYAEDELPSLIEAERITRVVFAYSDVSHDHVMDRAASVVARGATFELPSAAQLMLPSTVPVISVCAVRTGCGKSQTSRKIAGILHGMGKRVVVVRHPMPYGDLVKQRVQRFATYDDLLAHDCTIEEREEYEPHLAEGAIVMAGVDYQAILAEAEKSADVIIWDGGNNDTPFFAPTLEIVVADPHRAGHELTYYPGSVNIRRAGVVIINKVDTAAEADVALVEANVRRVNPKAVIIRAASPVTVENGAALAGKRVLVVEDGPTVTHGGMSFGAGVVAARTLGASEIVDPRPCAVGSLVDVFQKYSQVRAVLPAMGYGKAQVADLEATIRRCDCDAVIVATPIDLARLITVDKPMHRVQYSLEELSGPTLEELLRTVL